ncbi:TonB-dependent receptor [Sphingomonas sp. AR_OL41]|uniref:TonB-dependent receptor n=1 Tax=Sphingomonas sp. AR_OL41 TaxID=3042729 RepID=UPI0024817AE1|nr:TonB-dependent receptor [Sphingomonas sp. AR_OL41]MDH7971935.1 TonB-dependent receptor [Sphingomonas sp. AR_OL41]
MRLKSIILGSTSLLVLGAALPAAAQTAPSTPPTAPEAGDDAAAGADIVVTGLRRSIESAQAIKRDSIQQVDSIVASDIGKLPDIAVSDTAARIVGVQVDRGGGEASRVLVRGLPDFTTTYNGREIFTAEARSVALQDFPSGAISALEVYKNTTADLVEGGLAGEINVRSRRPFDFDGFKIAGSAWGLYTKRSKNYDPNGNLLVSDRWDTGIGEIGLLVGGSYNRLRYLDSTRSNTDYVANSGIGPAGANVRFPDIQRIDFGQGDRVRPSVNGAIQWRPAPGLEFYGEALWQGFRNKVSDRETSVPLWGGSAYSNVVTTGSGPNARVQSLTVTNPFRPDGFQGATYAKTDTYQYALGGKYDAGRLHVTADLAHTTSTFFDSIYSFDTAYAAPTTITANTGVGSLDAGPSFTFANGVDPTKASNYIYRGFFDRQLIAHGSDYQGRIDLAYDTGVPALTRIEAGFRYVDRDAHFEDGSRYSSREGERLPLSAVPVSYYVAPSGFPGSDPTTLRGYYTPTYDSIRNNIAQLRAFSGFAPGAPPPDPSVTYSANERSYAGYFQAKYAFGDTAGIHVDGVVGLRVVETDLRINGTNRIHNAGAPDSFAPITVTKTYYDWLPNASARLHFTDQLQLRLSYTETRTRPSFSQYNPGLAVDPPTSGNATRFANGGNPDLKPLHSQNFDASLEYYFSRTGSISGAVFRRDLNGFIQNYNQAIIDPTFGPITVNRPYNTGRGRIDGFEAQATTFLDFAMLPAWAHAFGVQGNVTYLDAKTGVPASLGGTITQAPIIGVSKWTYNLAAFYELNGLAMRVSWNHRGAYPSRFEPRGGDTYAETTKGIGRLDLSASYDVIKNVTIFADATNVLAKPLVTYLTYGFNGGADPVTFPRGVRYEESVYSLGVRFRL